MFDSPPQAMITVVDRSGRKSTVARDWTGIGLAWRAMGTEIRFTATGPAPGGSAPSLHAVSLSGVVRPVYRAADWLVLHDISKDGRVLMSGANHRINMACKRPQDTSERDRTWECLAARGTPTDGHTLILEDELLCRARETR